MPEGTVITLDADTLGLYESRRKPEVAIPVTQITKLEIYRGHEGSAAAAVGHAAVGFAVGSVFGALLGTATEAVFADVWDLEPDLGEAAAEGAVIGALDGAIAKRLSRASGFACAG